MLYAIMSSDVPDSLPKRASARDRHLARITQLLEDGRLVIAGPHPAVDSNEPGEAGFTGSLVVAEFDSLESAQKWAEEDPYLEAGAYAQVVVRPFKQVFP